MKKLKNYLETFKILLLQLNDEKNIVIGGTQALLCHGLLFREPDDLDMIIFNPSDRQMQVFENLKSFEVENPVDDIYTQISFKYKKNGLVINFLLAKDTDLPENLLIESNGWKVNSIANIIEAKKIYNRKKDLQDLRTIIFKNF